MPRLVYRPNHPNANQNGMVDADVNEIESAPYVISDEMPALRHMADGKHYTSKKKFREATRAAGCIEWGSEIPKPRKPIPLDRRKRVEDIKRTIYELRNGIRRET